MQDPKIEGEWLRLKDVARLKGVTEDAVWHMVREKRLRTIEVDGQTVVPKDEVARYLQIRSGRPRWKY